MTTFEVDIVSNGVVIVDADSKDEAIKTALHYAEYHDDRVLYWDHNVETVTTK
jgi:hypothetical protein